MEPVDFADNRAPATVPRRPNSQPPVRPVSLSQRNRAEVEVAELAKKWISAYLRGERKQAISRTIQEVLQKTAPEILLCFTSSPIILPSIEAASRAVDSWVQGSGESLGPNNQVEKILGKLRTEVKRAEMRA